MSEPKGWTYRPDQAKPYSAQISINGKLKHLGSFYTKEEAHAAAVKERAANPKQPNKGGRKIGNYFVKHPKKTCNICKMDYVAANFAKHIESCKEKAIIKASRPFNRNRLIVYKGERGTIVEFAQRAGISISTVRQRYYTGWSINNLFNPVHKKEN